jgi:ABC-type phosphate/phosphonate transport system ATPase subunit
MKEKHLYIAKLKKGEQEKGMKEEEIFFFSFSFFSSIGRRGSGKETLQRALQFFKLSRAP